MDLGRKITRLWSAASEEAGGKENLTELLTRLAFLLSGGWILAIAFADWSRSLFFASPGLTAALFVAFALGVIDVAAGLQVWIPARRLSILLPFTIAYLVGVHYWSFVLVVPFYGTDGMAYDHYSALLLLGGNNPYAVDHSPALERFGVPSFFVTPTESGGIVSRQTYPALSFLLYVPFVAAGVPDLRVVSLAAHWLAIGVAYRVTPPPLRAFAPMTLAFLDQLDFTPGSVQDILWVAPLLLSVATMGRRIPSGALFGIACSIKPLPWLLAPFLFVHLWKLDGTRLPTSRGLWSFVLSAAGSFLVFNGPFLVWDAGAWTSGVLSPLLEGTVPLGPGLSLWVQGAWLSAPRQFYLFAMASALLAFLAIEFFDHEKARHLLWWFPAIAMFLSYRSLQNYFIYWYPFLLLALAGWFRERISGVIRAPAR